MTMSELWLSSCDPNNRDFGKEMSARNPFLKSYVNLGLAQICAILDLNSQPRESTNLNSIIEQDDASRHFLINYQTLRRQYVLVFQKNTVPQGQNI